LFFWLELANIQPSQSDCQILGNASAVVGGIIGIVTGFYISLLFYYIQEKNKKFLAELKTDIKSLSASYIVRTCLLNLLDVFEGKSHKIVPSDANRKKYQERLEKYIKEFKVTNKDLKEISKDANDPDHTIKPSEIWETHQKDCNTCINLSKKIKDYLDEHENPLEQ